MTEDDAIRLLLTHQPRDILCLGAKGGRMTRVLNVLEEKKPDVFNKHTVFASSGARGKAATRPDRNCAIFTTYDSSKGLERDICVLFDFTEQYWQRRLEKPGQDYAILRNIFAVAASRGKKRIIFVKGTDPLLTEKTIKASAKMRKSGMNVTIEQMFSFKKQEDIARCAKAISVRPLHQPSDLLPIEVRQTDGLIDLSPCMDILQKALYFQNYSIEKAVEMELVRHKHLRPLWEREVRHTSLDEKILFLVSLQTGQERYRTQVQGLLLDDLARRQIIRRLDETFLGTEQVQVDAALELGKLPGQSRPMTITGLADVVKDGTVYVLKFADEISTSDFLQCACYMGALKLPRGIVMNTKTGERFGVRVRNGWLFRRYVKKVI